MSHRGGGLIEAARICNSPGGSSAAIIHQKCAPRERKQQFVPFLLLFSIFDHRSFEIIVAGVQRTAKAAVVAVVVVAGAQTKTQNAAQHCESQTCSAKSLTLVAIIK